MDYQDALAEIGAANAHPGGWSVTKLWRDALDWTGVKDVLEIGCGTGSTLAELCAWAGCSGTGVDIRRAMIQKARKRAHTLGLHHIHFEVADAEHLPFPDETVDLVFTESVNVFSANPLPAIREYARVLKPNGVYVDVEMLVMQPVDDAWRQGVQNVYGARFVPDQKGWKRLYRNAGFTNIEVLTTRRVDPLAMAQANSNAYPNAAMMDLSNPGVYQRKEILEVLQSNSEWMERNSRPLGYGVFLCRK
ncbi:class I SAM-dependent methyltransferase [Alicyclobacillus ferrooxydans]|uniref:class I SAM-dependent methyltransferase n=1 Tax=Alicyclobacillus ferrooxydans TaxID=471514 RepID=UPI0006D54BCF|nr:class I SAM-dependent methyltransferase [Alicyclobacillus ferrooxydans]